MKFEVDKLVFESTGAKAWTSCNIVSIDEELQLATGYDCSFHMDIRDDGKLREPRELTREERHELADHYIQLWTRFKDS
jgi:hypothetical protein